MAGEVEIFGGRLIPYKASTAWFAANPTFTPLDGEYVVELTTPRKLKIGDGVTAWPALPYLTSGTGTPQSLQDTLNIGNSAVQGGGNTGIISLQDASNTALLSPGQLRISDFISGFDLVGMSVDGGGNGYLFLKSTSNANIGTIKPISTGFTFPQTWELPNKSGVFAMLSDVAAAGTLQGVLNAGNSAIQGGGDTGVIKLDGNGAGNYITLSPTGGNGLVIQNLTSLGQVVARLIANAGNGFLSLRNSGSASNYLATLKSGVLSGNRSYLLPDEGAGAGIDDTIVLHKTKDSITVGNITTAWIVANTLGWLESNKIISGTELAKCLLVNYGIICIWDDTSGSPFSYTNALEGWAGAVAGVAPPVGAASYTNILPQSSSQLFGIVNTTYHAAVTATGTLSIASIICPAGRDCTFSATAFINITAIAGNTLQVQTSFTDVHGTVTNILHPVVAGATATNMTAVGFYPAQEITFRAKAGTAITVSVLIPVFAGTNTYDAEGFIKQLN